MELYKQVQEQGKKKTNPRGVAKLLPTVKHSVWFYLNQIIFEWFKIIGMMGAMCSHMTRSNNSRWAPDKNQVNELWNWAFSHITEVIDYRFPQYYGNWRRIWTSRWVGDWILDWYWWYYSIGQTDTCLLNLHSYSLDMCYWRRRRYRGVERDWRSQFSTLVVKFQFGMGDIVREGKKRGRKIKTKSKSKMKRGKKYK